MIILRIISIYGIISELQSTIYPSQPVVMEHMNTGVFIVHEDLETAGMHSLIVLYNHTSFNSYTIRIFNIIYIFSSC